MIISLLCCRHIYLYCENAISNDKGTYEFEIKSYSPRNLNLQEIAAHLRSANVNSENTPPWMNYLRDGLDILTSQGEQDFHAPNQSTDKLYMRIGDRDLIEVAHPVPQDNSVKR